MSCWKSLESKWEEGYKYEGRIMMDLSQPEIN